MVGWHNAAGTAPVANWWTDGDNVIAFSRGSAAWVAINAESAPVTETFSTGLPAGTYCDVISGAAAGGACTGTVVAVSAAGQATVTVPALGAVGIDVEETADCGYVANRTMSVDGGFVDDTVAAWAGLGSC
jgi:alpha-amylase